MTGRTIWLAKDIAWWRREWIVALGEEFGADGPAVIDWLECEAKAQNAGGYVKAGPRTISRGTFVDAVTVGHVVSRAVTLGLLEDYFESEGRFTCRISGWKADQERALATSRKAKSRGGQSVNTGDQASVVTVGHAESRSVTECHPTEEKRTEETASTKQSSRRDRDDVERTKASDDDRRLCRLLAGMAKEHNPKLRVEKDAAWLRSMRLLREEDGNTPDEIERVIRWTFAGGSEDAVFWANTIQSASGLRKHFAQVWARMQSPQSQRAAIVSDLDAKRLASLRKLEERNAS